MEKSKLFQYAIIWHPTEKQVKEGEKPKVLVELTTILAKDNQSAAMQAAMQIPAEYKEQIDQIDVAVRPF
jgi:hypothetical protein